MHSTRAILQQMADDMSKGNMTTSSSADGKILRPLCRQKRVGQRRSSMPHLQRRRLSVRDVPFGHPEFNRLIPCRCKLQDVEDRQQERLRKMSNLGELARMTFKSFLP